MIFAVLLVTGQVISPRFGDYLGNPSKNARLSTPGTALTLLNKDCLKCVDSKLDPADKLLIYLSHSGRTLLDQLRVIGRAYTDEQAVADIVHNHASRLLPCLDRLNIFIACRFTHPSDRSVDDATIAHQVITAIHEYIPILMKPICKFLPDSHRPRYNEFFTPGPKLACTSVLVSGFREYQLTAPSAFEGFPDHYEVIGNRKRVPMTLDKRLAFLDTMGEGIDRLIDCVTGDTADVMSAPPSEFQRWWWLPSRRIILDVTLFHNVFITVWLANGTSIIIHNSDRTPAGAAIPMGPDATLDESFLLRLRVEGDYAVLTFCWDGYGESWMYELSSPSWDSPVRVDATEYVAGGVLGAEIELKSMTSDVVLLRSWSAEVVEQPVDVDEGPLSGLFSICSVS